VEEAVAWYECNSKAPRASDQAVHAKVFPHVLALEQDQRDISTLNSLNSKL